MKTSTGTSVWNVARLRKPHGRIRITPAAAPASRLQNAADQVRVSHTFHDASSLRPPSSGESAAALTEQAARCAPEVDRASARGKWPRPNPRPLLDPQVPEGFIRYPYYSVPEVAQILGVSGTFVRAVFRGGKHGRVLEIYNFKPGRRTYRTTLIPYPTLAAFIERFSKGR